MAGSDDRAPLILEADDLATESAILRQRLEDHGLSNQARVAILADNSAEFIIARDAIARGGWVAVPINHKLTAPEIEFILRHIRFSHQPAHQTIYMSDADYRWKLIDDFGHAINARRAKKFNPSSLLCCN